MTHISLLCEAAKPQNTHASAIDEAEADLRAAIEELKRGADCTHPLTKNLAMSFAKVSIENALLSLSLARESSEIRPVSCPRCTQLFANTDDAVEFADCCEDRDCPLQRGETSVVIA